MASVTVNGSLALDFVSSEEKSREDSPISGTGYESPYQELSADDDFRNAIQEEGRSKMELEVIAPEQTRPPAAKKRRKQSNPVRFASLRLTDPKQDADFGPLDLAGDSVDDGPSLDRMPALYRCSHCNALFESDEDLRSHIEDEHVQKVLERQLQHHNLTKAQAKEAASMMDKDEPPELTLSYQALHEMKENLKMGLVPSSMPQLTPNVPPPSSTDTKDAMGCVMPPLSSPYGPPPFLIPLLAGAPSSSQPSSVGSNMGGLSAPPIRIFNPEAYCEICNKEFCNKYFLKTHKANKHGVYSMDTLTGSPYANAFLTANVSAAATLSMRSLLPTTCTPATSSVGDMGTVAKTAGPLNVEAYCEICQKEFCNKYFLRKHRQKIHGILDPSITSTGGPPSATPSTAQTTNGMTVSPTSTLDSPISNSSSSSVPGVTMSNHVDSIVNELYAKDFANRNNNNNNSNNNNNNNNMINNNSQCVKYTTTFNPPSLTTLSTSTCVSQMEDEKGLVGQRPFIKPIMGVLSAERLREIGVVNVDAFCDICFKEFCNKYFLRTHKLNKHGISLPDSSPGIPSGSPGTADDPSMPTTPKMAMVGNEAGRATEETNGLTCDVCGRPFASSYLLKMHKFYSHNIAPVDRDDVGLDCPLAVKEEVAHDQNDNQVKNETGEDLRKLQTMIQELNAPSVSRDRSVFCNLCRKEMDNKYFLRAHMMNEHGVLHNEESNSGESNASIKASPGTPSANKDQSPFVHRKMAFPVLPSPAESDTCCDICKKDFGTKYFLHVHKTNTHGLPMDLSMAGTSSESSNNVQNPRMNNPEQMVSGDRPSLVTGRNYCELCNKELCNKYFMKTHMLKMHGINIEDGAGIKGAAIIGGVTCDICQKELCSKYFLKVHKQNTHGIFEESPPGKENSASTSASSSSAMERDLGIMPGEITEDNCRYLSHYTEACPVCDRRFKSIKWLKTHMVNDHNDPNKENGFGPSASKQHQQHQQHLQPQQHLLQQEMNRTCMVCGKIFSDAINLQVHTITCHYASGPNEMNLADQQCPVTLKTANSNASGNPETRVDGRTDSGKCGNENSSERARQSGNGSRIYHCSYCPYSTRWLSNLYAHEKRHTGLVAETDKKFSCRLCPRAYRYNHSLQRHMVSHRRAAAAAASTSEAPTNLEQSPLPPSSSSSSLPVAALAPANLTSSESAPVGEVDWRLKQRPKKYRCSKCSVKFRSRKFCLAHIHEVHGARSGAPLVTAFYQKGVRLFKCRKCGFTCRRVNNLKQHIRQEHDQLASDCQPRPKEVDDSNKTQDDWSNAWMGASSPSKASGTSPDGQIPMTYAMPQNPPTVGSFIMQPFLMAQPLEERANANDSNVSTFVPSLVYLPVCHKVSEPVTVAFTLTPA